jgi:hypothetical protein
MTGAAITMAETVDLLRGEGHYAAADFLVPIIKSRQDECDPQGIRDVLAMLVPHLQPSDTDISHIVARAQLRRRQALTDAITAWIKENP